MYYKINNLDDTKKLAKIIANLVDKKFIITIDGNLAAGKTTFTKYFAQYIGVEEIVNSPTFNIIKEYDSKKGIFYHIDAYRLEGIVEDLGFEDIFYENNIIIIEWAEFIEEFLPQEKLIIKIVLSDNDRLVYIDGVGDYYKNILKEIDNQWLL